MLDKSPDKPADPYAVDAVHEFPFRVPGSPPRLRGREEIRTYYRRVWASMPAWMNEIQNVVVYDAADPEIVVGDWVGTGALTIDGRPFRGTGLRVLRVRDGESVETRDYTDVFGTFQAIGLLKHRRRPVGRPPRREAVPMVAPATDGRGFPSSMRRTNHVRRQPSGAVGVPRIGATRPYPFTPPETVHQWRARRRQGTRVSSAIPAQHGLAERCPGRTGRIAVREHGLVRIGLTCATISSNSSSTLPSRGGWS